jgi:hypothetical protein
VIGEALGGETFETGHLRLPAVGPQIDVDPVLDGLSLG